MKKSLNLILKASIFILFTFLIGSVHGQNFNSEKLYILQIIQVPNYYSNFETVYTKDQVLGIFEKNFSSALRTRSFFFRNSQEQQFDDEHFESNPQIILPTNRIQVTPTSNPPSNNPPSSSNPPQPTNNPLETNNAPSFQRSISPPTGIPPTQRSVPPANNPSSLNPSSNSPTGDPGLNAPIDVQRTYLLTRLNSMRKQFGSEPLYLDDRLNSISQGHSLQMSQTKVFEHTNSRGEGPRDRAIKAGFTDQVGQNIARNFGLEKAHISLRNSPGHFNNSINPDYTRVGFGIVVASDGWLWLTVMFSTRDCEQFPISQADMTNLRRNIVNVIIQRDPYINGENPAISRGIQNWIKSGQSGSIFSFIFAQGVQNVAQMKADYQNYSQNLAEKYLTASTFLFNNPTVTKIGVGIFRKQGCTLHIFVVYGN